MLQLWNDGRLLHLGNEPAHTALPVKQFLTSKNITLKEVSFLFTKSVSMVSVQNLVISPLEFPRHGFFPILFHLDIPLLSLWPGFTFEHPSTESLPELLRCQGRRTESGQQKKPA
ncbi:hypothetical protein TNCV_4833061 [Trichonephila clavipes]|nr:hypothetical protein TNCV_4833061 [Trichonephila clavipes]